MGNQLDDINWSFGIRAAGASRLVDARRHHWYPATYIPEVPFTLIELLSAPGAVVFDPFAGIGTTVWQALALNRVPAAVEVSRVAAQIMRAMWVLLSPDARIGEAQAELRMALSTWDGGDYEEFLGQDRAELLTPWFTAGTLRELSFLARVEAELRSPVANAMLFLLVSNSLKRWCEQRRGWGCIADNMRPRESDLNLAPVTRAPVASTLKRMDLLCASLTADRALIDRDFFRSLGPVEEHILWADSRVAQNLQECDLLVTSPPYPGMTDYATSQRLSYYWLGKEPERDVVVEIGARRKRFRRTWLEEYEKDARDAVVASASRVRPGGLAAFVIPIFATDDVHDDRDSVVESSWGSLEDGDFDEIWRGERFLPNARRQQNQKWAHLQRERIVIFRRRA